MKGATRFPEPRGRLAPSKTRHVIKLTRIPVPIDFTITFITFQIALLLIGPLCALSQEIVIPPGLFTR